MAIVIPAAVPATTFDSMTADVAPFVPGCPTAIISATLRKVAIDLCDRAKVWRTALMPTTAVAGTYNYALVAPVANTEVSAILYANAYLTTAATTKPMDVTTGEVMFLSHPDWPNTAAPGEPQTLFNTDDQTINVFPVPDAADTYTLNIFAAIRPTHLSTGISTAVSNQYRRELFHGTLHELMLIPDRVWTDPEKSLYHGKQWTYLLNAARARANKGFGRASINVVPRPWA